MRNLISTSLVILLILAAGCASGDGIQAEEKFQAKDGHSAEFLWTECKTVLKGQGYRIAEEDSKAHTLTTTWKFVQGAFSHGDFQGSRTRLEVSVVGTLMDGHTVEVKETRERNTSQKSMLLEDADWEPDEADGRSASVFIFGLERRLHPSEDWRFSQRR